MMIGFLEGVKFKKLFMFLNKMLKYIENIEIIVNIDKI